MLVVAALSALLFTRGVNAHVGAWAKGMYCEFGTSDGRWNAGDMANPLYQLPFEKWWLHNVSSEKNASCLQFPPPDGDYLELPAGKSLTVELASNHACTTLSNPEFKNAFVTDWPDCKNHTFIDDSSPTCITEPNLHTTSKEMAAGTVFAISYNSDIKAVKPENLVVFTVAYHTPWKRLASYDVPAAMPECPAGGCICAWGWVPNGCGEPNMFMQPFKCKVTGATSTTPLAPAKPPVWCEGEPDKCVKGAKQMVYWHQADGNNVIVDGNDNSGRAKSPGYNAKMGFADGAQNDIFQETPTKGELPAVLADATKDDKNAITTNPTDPVAPPTKAAPDSDKIDSKIPPCSQKKARGAVDVENVIKGRSAHGRRVRHMF